MSKEKDSKVNHDKFGDNDWTKTFRLPTADDIALSRNKPTEKPKPRK